jgi:hypothetical protein
MVKKQKTTVWFVTLPGGKRQEIDASVASKYFLDDAVATPFSHLSVKKVIRLRPVKPLPPPPAPPEPELVIGRKRRKLRPATPRRVAARARRLARLRAVVRSRRYAAARRLRRR